MNKLYILGLGPGDKKYLIDESIKLLESIKNKNQTLYLRTDKHPIIEYLNENNINYNSFDYIYDESENFDDVYLSIANEILKKLEKEDVYYAVPGNPFIAEKTVTNLLEKYENVQIIHGISFLDILITRLKIDVIYGMNVINPLEARMNINNSVDNVIMQVYDKIVAGEVKLELMNYFDDKKEVIIAKNIGLCDEQIDSVKLYELDRYEYNHLTSLYIKKDIIEEKKVFSLNDTLDKIKELIDNDLIVEDNNLFEKLKKEIDLMDKNLKDNEYFLVQDNIEILLKEILIISQKARKFGYFDVADVISSIYKKLQ